MATLFLIPSGLSEENTARYLPEDTLRVVFQIKQFVVERAKTARHFLKSIGYPHHFDEVEMIELDKHQSNNGHSILKALDSSMDIGLISEAGVPAVADPGSVVVHSAHQLGINVHPLVGPSSILLALMSSGMNGQRFSFQGYLPKNQDELMRSLRQLEQESRKFNMSQIFIETPYRNDKLLSVMLQSLSAETELCIASNLHSAGQKIKTLPIYKWRKEKLDLKKKPTVFVLYSGDLDEKK